MRFNPKTHDKRRRNYILLSQRGNGEPSIVHGRYDEDEEDLGIFVQEISDDLDGKDVILDWMSEVDFDEDKEEAPGYFQDSIDKMLGSQRKTEATKPRQRPIRRVAKKCSYITAAIAAFVASILISTVFQND